MSHENHTALTLFEPITVHLLPYIPNMTDIGHGQRFASTFCGKAIWNATAQHWMIYDGCRWIVDDKQWHMQMAKQIPERIRTIEKEFVQRFVEDRIWDYPEDLHIQIRATAQMMLSESYKASYKLESAGKLNAMLKMARSERDMIATDTEFDCDPMLLNCRNGTINLSTGELRPHDPWDMIANLAPCDYDPNATAPTWERFIDETFSGDEALIDYVQRFLGYSLTGLVQEQIFPVWYGMGANGKSTLLDTVLAIMGSYATTSPMLFSQRMGSDEHPTELADLLGKRLVVSSETEKDRSLKVQQVKRLTGEAKIKARRMRQDYTEFDRTCKPVMVTNNCPVIDEDTEGIWRRVKLIPFEHVVPIDQRDPKLGQKLMAEASGILNWLVAGCLHWQQDGLVEPLVVCEATARYRQEADPHACFLNEHCVFGPQHRIETGRLRDAYERYCQEAGVMPESARVFTDRLKKRSCQSHRTGTTRSWQGLTLLEQA